MVFGLSSNPAFGTYPRQCCLCILTCPSLTAVASRVPYVGPLLTAIAGQKSPISFPSILQRTGPRAVADRRIQEGIILLLGKLPHRVFDVFFIQDTMSEWRGPA